MYTQQEIQNSKVEKMGGNQWRVTIGEDSEIVDLDGCTLVSDEDYNRLEEKGCDTESFFAPQHSEGDVFWEEAVRRALQYSGFDVEEYIIHQVEHTWEEAQVIFEKIKNEIIRAYTGKYEMKDMLEIPSVQTSWIQRILDTLDEGKRYIEIPSYLTFSGNPEIISF